MAEATESQLTILCLQCEWSVETVNTPAEVSTAFLEAAHSHVDEHEQHAIEVVQRLRLYSENYVEAPECNDVQNSNTAAPDSPATVVSIETRTEPAAQLQDMSMADIPEDVRKTSARRDGGMQTGFLDKAPRRDH